MMMYNISERKRDCVIIFAIIENEEDRTKAERLYEKYKYLMYKKAYEILKNTSDAEDAVSQAFLRVINNLHKIDESNQPATASFLVMICKNVAKSKIDEIAKRMSFEDPIDDNLQYSSNSFLPENIVISKETTEQLSHAVNSLDEIYKDVILLRYYFDCSINEISGILNLKTDTVKKRLTRAKKLVCEKFESCREQGAV